MDRTVKPGEKWEKLKGKIARDPLIPIGCLVTLGVLTAALRSFHLGNSQLSNKLLRGRVAAQGVTVGFVMYGMYKASLGTGEESTFREKSYTGNLATAEDERSR